MGEVDVFQLDSTHEHYAHLNANYVRLPRLPDFEDYGDTVEALACGATVKKFRGTRPLDTTSAFGGNEVTWSVPARNWKWARLAVWDVAGNGALTNPM